MNLIILEPAVSEELNKMWKVYDEWWMPSDDKKSHGLWTGALKLEAPRSL